MNKDLVLACLRRRNRPLCDDCISAISGVKPRQQVNQICRRMAANGQIIREHGVCRHCEGEKLVNRVA